MHFNTLRNTSLLTRFAQCLCLSGSLEPVEVSPEAQKLASVPPPSPSAAGAAAKAKPTRKVALNLPAQCADGDEALVAEDANYISTTQYTLLTFLPKNLFLQLSKAANFYFLLMAIIVCIPSVASVDPYTSVMPLIFVLGVTAIKEAIEDYGRYKSDRVVNSRAAQIVADPARANQPVRGACMSLE